jgi:hypothetical protein
MVTIESLIRPCCIENIRGYCCLPPQFVELAGPRLIAPTESSPNLCGPAHSHWFAML